MNGATPDEHIARVRNQGFTIIEDAIEPALVKSLSVALQRLEHELGARPAGNAFEGAATVRIYNLLAYGSPFDEIPVHG